MPKSLNFHLTEEELAGITRAIKHDKRPEVRQRAMGLRLLHQGPTPKEVFGDIRYGLGSLAKAFAEKGPPILQIIKGLGSKVKSGVEAAWDAVRGEPTSVQGNAFPQPGSDTKDYFSSIDTGIAQVDPDNMLVQIAMENADKDYSDNRSFEEKEGKARHRPRWNSRSVGSETSGRG